MQWNSDISNPNSMLGPVTMSKCTQKTCEQTNLLLRERVSPSALDKATLQSICRNKIH